MKIKTKLNLGVGFLFLLIALLAIVGAKYINALSNDTQNILEANYNTLEYERQMLIALDEHKTDNHAFSKFAENLAKQQGNITEIGEKEATNHLTEQFNKLEEDPQNSDLLFSIRQDLYEIMKINMQAIERKSNIAKATAHKATLWIAITGLLCFGLAFTLLIKLPGNIADPIEELTNSIRQIAAKNYNQRVNFESHNEYGELATSFNTMAEKLEEYEGINVSKIVFEKKRIETLINNMHDPIVGLDDALKILFVNNEALKILGMNPEDIIGHFAQEIANKNDLLASLIQDLILGNNSYEKPSKGPMKIYADNKESYFEKEIVSISIVPEGEPKKRHIGYFIILKNITSFKELDSAKTNFIATVSHELKTPVSSIKMSLQLLENDKTGSINNEQKQLIASIQDDTNRLLKIIGELLNMSQVETGNIQLTIQQSSPKDILNYALEAVKIQAEQKQVRINVKIEKDLPNVKADTEKTAWVLINLLTNSIRNSPLKNEIVLEVKKEESQVLFSVKDVGKGIDIRYRSKIFDRYFQIPGSTKAGTGLGLAICKEFIEAQGGKIWVESEIGEGSKFSFLLKS